MPTPAERQALLFLAIVLGLGAGARLLRSSASAPAPSAGTAVATQLAAVDHLIAARRRAPPPRPTVDPRPVPPPASPPGSPRPTPRVAAPIPVDVDVAPESLLVTLPGIGPTLARRIVEDRGRHGPFGSMAGLLRVRGIGEKSAARLAALVTFSQAPRPR